MSDQLKFEHHPYCSIHAIGKCDCQSPLVTPRQWSEEETELMTTVFKMRGAWMRHKEAMATATNFAGITQAADHMDEAFDLIPQLYDQAKAVFTQPGARG